MQKVIIYSDGSCLGNPGPGGWAAVVQRVGAREQVAAETVRQGYEPHTTNNRMELRAVIEALRSLPGASEVELRLDSQYVAGALQGNRVRANQELVSHLRSLAARHRVTVAKVAAHAGVSGNERVDGLARAQAEQLARLLRTPTRVIVAGSRTFNDAALLAHKLDGILARCQEVVVVSGGARGADQLGEQYAQERGLGCIRMAADWELYGKSAGYRRNEQMLEIATHVVLFHVRDSPGTAHMRAIAETRGLPMRVIRYPPA
jgi:ribonuclease HI